jgi:hypothetical protein
MLRHPKTGRAVTHGRRSSKPISSTNVTLRQNGSPVPKHPPTRAQISVVQQNRRIARITPTS